jgi:hypothetical protein
MWYFGSVDDALLVIVLRGTFPAAVNLVIVNTEAVRRRHTVIREPHRSWG